ncbi:MAG: beta-ketoacyl-ACP synthase II [Dehalococcoidia bacterium]|nr:beta-ketoacyl-ACP synthase II [Dehalococcoidia bacterium]
MEKPRVVVTGLGAVTPIGLNAEDFWTSLTSGKSGIGHITHFDVSNFPIKVAAEIPGDFDPTHYMHPKMVDRTARAVHLAIPALKEALASSRLDMDKEQVERVGVVTATLVETAYLIKGKELLEKHGARRADPLFITKSSPSALAMQIGMITGARGPNTYVDSLCASGTDAMGAALNFMRLGYTDVMIVAGSDASLDPTTLAGMNILGALSRSSDPTTACRPFDLNRNGFVYGEAAGVVILETYEHAKKRNAPIIAEFGGAGWSFDAYDSTAPYAETQAIAMSVALRDAGIKPEDLDYINAHGTSTKLNDVCETKAVKILLGEEKAHKTPISSNKSMLGHSITATGLIEAIASILTVSRGILPPTINYATPAPACDLAYVPNKASKVEINNCLSNGFGLGGENCCIVFKRFAD